MTLSTQVFAAQPSLRHCRLAENANNNSFTPSPTSPAWQVMLVLDHREQFGGRGGAAAAGRLEMHADAAAQLRNLGVTVDARPRVSQSCQLCLPRVCKKCMHALAHLRPSPFARRRENALACHMTCLIQLVAICLR